MEEDKEMQFTIAGKRISLSKKSIENSLKEIKPETIRKYSVHIGETDFPIKQVVSIASGVPIVAFITTDAYRILTRLGFEVKC